MNSRDLRVIFFYEFKSNHSGSVAAQNINAAFGEGTVNERTIQRWFKKFKNGDESLENEPRGRPESTLDDTVLRAHVESNPRTTVREIAQELGVSTATISRHLSTIGKVKKLDKWVPHELNENQMKNRFEICSSLLLRNQREPFLNRIITCDEKWILYDNRRRSAQWLDANESPKTTPKAPLHPKKVMITVWWSMAGIIHFKFLNAGETVTALKYKAEIEVMHQKLRQMQPALVNRKGPILLHDNARPHVSLIVANKLAELNYEVLPHPPYSPDISPTDYHFFKHLDNFLRDKKFTNLEQIKNDFQSFIDTRDLNFYENGIQKLVTRWQKCVDCDGFYFD